MLVNEIKLYGEPESGEAIDDIEDSFSEFEDVISKVGDYSVNCPHVFVFVNLLLFVSFYSFLFDIIGLIIHYSIEIF